jgi:hypothetical protein
VFWRPFNPKDISRYLLAAERFDRAGRQKGDRSGPLGAVALEVLRELSSGPTACLCGLGKG